MLMLSDVVVYMQVQIILSLNNVYEEK